MDYASAGEFWFAPATMMQMRPVAKTLDPLVRGMELSHERTHWFQFAGSTIGSLIFTLHRAEHFLLLAYAGPRGSAHLGFRRAIADRQKIDRRSDKGEQLSNLGQLLDFLRSVRTELLRSGMPSDPGWSLRWKGVQLLAAATYGAHTGAETSTVELVEMIDAERLVGSLPRDVQSEGLTTVHVLEAGARLSEWASFLSVGWGRAAPGSRYTAISTSLQPYVADRLRYGGELYRRAFDVALEHWGEPTCLDDPRQAADALGRWLPTLVACIDIALNPRVAPMVPCEDREPETVFPGVRFSRAVEASGRVGAVETWPSEPEYAAYRDSIAEAIHSGTGQRAGRSFQHERFNAEFWTTATTDDELLGRTSYFDYLIWVMERMHEFRRNRPLDWSLPGLLRQSRGTRGADLQLLIDPESVWVHAPLYWVGDEWGVEGRLSESVGVALAIDIAASALATQAAGGTGALTLDEVLPPALACDEAFVRAALHGVLSGTGWDELREWKLVVPSSSDGEARSSEESAKGDPEDATLPAPTVRVELERAAVEQGDVTVITNNLVELRRSPLENRWTMDLAFHSYDGDPRELWEIPATVEYYRLISASVPDWPWYFHPPETAVAGSAAFILTALSQFRNPRSPTHDEWEQLVHRVFGGFNAGIPDDPTFDPEADWHEVAGPVMNRALEVLRNLRLG
jgi:hypothetical protein